eukprot:TRINITY_DN3516_c0_g1_i2.p2 TRINITY_DN3516_c0_g1~~TRINITY_DN3516_c0_g1_i2.p2  ORF type:complete len:122 (+),score=44.23 TRINITY_DN3516_c0_g1_i2:172-537(+)
MCIRDRRKYNLNVPVHMMVILMLFNTEDSLTYQQIANATRINKHELDRALITLSMHKIRVLTTTLTKLNKNMKPDDVFSFNTGFSATHSKLKIQVSTVVLAMCSDMLLKLPPALQPRHDDG